MTVFEKIAAQQGNEETMVWQVGEQLKDICRNEPASAELVERDLDIPELSLAKCEAKIEAAARKKAKGGKAGVTYIEAERIIREFYGLPQRGERAEPAGGGIIDLADLL